MDRWYGCSTLNCSMDIVVRFRDTSEDMSTTYILIVSVCIFFKGDIMSKWDKRFIDMATMVGLWSKYPGSKVGSVITDQKNRVISVGFNGLPSGIVDTYSSDREDRLSRVIHAEENSLLFANRDLVGCKIYVTHHPCARCAAKIIQVGIREVHVDHRCLKGEFNDKWRQEITIATDLFNQSNTQVLFV